MLLEPGEFAEFVKAAGWLDWVDPSGVLKQIGRDLTRGFTEAGPFRRAVESGLPGNVGAVAGSDPKAVQVGSLDRVGVATPLLLGALGVPPAQAYAIGDGVNALAGAAGQAVGNRVGGVLDTRGITLNPSTWANPKKPVGPNAFGSTALKHINQAAVSGDLSSLDRWGVLPAGGGQK